jgi:hypothetical protein
MYSSGLPVTVPFVGADRGFQFTCMTALPDDKSFAIIGGYQFDQLSKRFGQLINLW